MNSLFVRAAAAYCSLVLVSLAIAAHAALAASQDSGQVMRAEMDPTNGRVTLAEGGQPVLRYNYKSVQPPAGYMDRVKESSRRYARPRSNYIHPLYGPNGEVLTADWCKDYPHHRGIYWAWPEVDFRGERGDLHALQRVFARPTGDMDLRDGPNFAQIKAVNVWKWEDKTEIVREDTTICAYRAQEHGRFIDLAFRFVALNDEVTIARRGTDNYGGLNIRLSPIQDHRVIMHTDPAGAQPRRAWADSVGVRTNGAQSVGMAIFAKQTNPQYPEQWIEFPDLPWLQPAFPAAGTRFVLKKGEPLELEYRLWIRHGEKASESTYIQRWDEFQDSVRLGRKQNNVEQPIRSQPTKNLPINEGEN